MPKLNLIPRKGQARELLPLELTDVQLLGSEVAESSPLARMKDEYKADDWKAYITFKINHSLPVVAGPLKSGNFTGYHPRVIAASYQSLLHQQVNLRHAIKAYDPDNVPRDRIVGCVVGAWFPHGDWSRIPQSKDQAPAITCVASIFKQAEGVNKMLGQHLTSREPWSVSIEVVFEIAQSGLYIPSQQKVVPIAEADDEMWAAVTRDPKSDRLRFGKYKGEQLVIVPGGEKGEVRYQGVGMTPDPAEREAHIVSVHAERVEIGDGMMAIAAERVPMAMLGRGVSWIDGAGRRASAQVVSFHDSGIVRLGLDARTATSASPILRCRLAGGTEILRSLSSVQVA